MYCGWSNIMVCLPFIIIFIYNFNFYTYTSYILHQILHKKHFIIKAFFSFGCIMKFIFINPITHGVWIQWVPQPYGLFFQYSKTQLNLCILVGLMQKDRVRSSELRESRNFEILVGNWEKNLVAQKSQILTLWIITSSFF